MDLFARTLQVSLLLIISDLNDWVVWRRLHPRPVGLLHVAPVRRELGQEGRRGNHAEKSAVGKNKGNREMGILFTYVHMGRL